MPAEDLKKKNEVNRKNRYAMIIVLPFVRWLRLQVWVSKQVRYLIFSAINRVILWRSHRARKNASWVPNFRTLFETNEKSIRTYIRTKLGLENVQSP